ncbi:MAG: PDZ domain-containing protein [Egibacteraceae bacterium]
MRLPRVVLLLTAGLLLMSAAVIVPLPFFLEAPGDVVGLGKRVKVGGPGSSPLDGEYLLTTVYLTPGTTLGLVSAWLDPSTRVLRAEEILEPGQDTRQFLDRQQTVFDETAAQAAAVGLRAAGFDVGPQDLHGDGVLVVRTVPGSAAQGLLLPEDVILRAAGRPVETREDLLDTLETARAGDPVRLTLRRSGRTLEVEVRPRPVPGSSERPILGIEPRTLNERIDLPVPVKVDSGGIGGPSAGLMIALTVFDKVDPVDLANGRRIAGTGTIALGGGEVGPIGGIEQKVLAAASQRIDVFVAPGVQLAEAREALPPTSPMEVIGVRTFDEAVDALKPL